MLFYQQFNKSPINRKKSNKSNNNLEEINNLTDFYDYINNVFTMDIRNTAKNTVIYDGARESNIMVIGEAPGADEDAMGKPFVGASGKLLMKMFGECSIERNDLYITNILFWRPPNNRPPTAQEITMSIPLLIKHIQLKQPKAILCLGNSCLKIFMEINHKFQSIEGQLSTISYTRGKLLKYNDIPLIFTFHPSYILRNMTQKYKVLEDIEKIKKYI